MEIKTTPHQLFAHLPDFSKLWIYQSNRLLTPSEQTYLYEQMVEFIEQWAAHGNKLAASFQLVDNLFLLIAVDEKAAIASGCSIDASVRFVQKLQTTIGNDFFNRLQVAYLINKKLRFGNLAQFEEQIKLGEVTPDTLVFNNTIQTVGELKNNWLIPAKNSWLSRYF